MATALTPAAEVRLLNGVALAVYALAAVALVAAGLAWLARSAGFPVRAIQIDGEVQRSSLATLRAHALPRLTGNFFSLDLDEARAAFESAPWVRRAVVRRVWPDRLSVRLEEHRAVALWRGPDGNERLVNEQGEVFEANVGDVDDDTLPLLEGPPGSAPRLRQVLARLQPVLTRHGREIELLRLSSRGSWRAELDGEARVEIGRGTDDEIVARTERFLATFTQVTGHFRAPLLHADLRHVDGYAVRLRNVTTPTPAPGPARRP
jgi:cell division protein FtsQ